MKRLVLATALAAFYLHGAGPSNYLFGGGYAFTQRFHLDASLIYQEITDDENFASDIDCELTSLALQRVTLGSDLTKG